MPPEPGSAPPPLPPELTPPLPADPAEIGPFRVVGRLGAGGMGVVYGALDDADRCVAVKVIKPDHAGSARYRALFAREAALLARIDAECAPRFLGADPDAPSPWLATEFVPGRTLHRHVRESGPLRDAELRAFAAGTAEALAAIHAAGVVHLDVKPGNIMLSPDGPRVLDFGIARAVEAAAGRDTHGTPGWVSPERLAGDAGGPAADVFAWGGLVVFAATGRPPFGTGSSAELLDRVRTGEYDTDGVPEELRGLVERALSGDPGARPTAQEAFEAVLALGEEAAPAAVAAASGGLAGRARLRALLDRVWTGFDAAGHRPELWAALGAAAGGTGVAGAAGGGLLAGAAGASGGVAKSVGAGTLVTGAAAGAGLGGKAVLTVAAGTTAVAVAAGGWVAGRAATDQPLLPFAEPEPSATAAPGPTPEPPGQRVRFRNLTLWFPEDWTVRTVEDAGFIGFEETVLMVDDWVVAYPPGQPACDGTDWGGIWGGPAVGVECVHVRVYGPGGIAYGGPSWLPITDDPQGGMFAPANDPMPCPAGTEPRAFASPPENPQLLELAPVGDRRALYREYLVPCTDGRPGLVYYEQRTWFLPESQIFVVDEYGLDGLDAVLAGGEFDPGSPGD